MPLSLTRGTSAARHATERESLLDALSLPTLLALSPSPRAPFPVCVSRGDVVEIIKDVSVKGEPAKGMVGEVIEDLEENDAEESFGCCEVAWGEPTLRVELRPTVTGYFAENEVKRISAAKTMDLVEGSVSSFTERCAGATRMAGRAR